MAKPVHSIRLGFIKVTIHRARSRSGIRYTVSVARLYRNGDTWKQSTRFGRDDIPAIRLALDKAHTWIIQNGNQKEKEYAAAK